MVLLYSSLNFYIFFLGILQKGDGGWMDMHSLPPSVTLKMGTKEKRKARCSNQKGCLEGALAKESSLLSVVSMTSGPDGSVYVGDLNLIRRIYPDGRVKTIMDMGPEQSSYHYDLAVSPLDQNIYMAVAEKRQVLTIANPDSEDESDFSSEEGESSKYDVFAGTGRRCLPGDGDACGDGGPAATARLDYPKSVVAAADGTVYISDGRSVRVVTPAGVIDTLIGARAGAGAAGPPKPLACKSIFAARDVHPQWPTKLALDPLDGTLHVADDTVVIRLTQDMQVQVMAGRSPLCNGADEDERTLSHISDMSFSPDGKLYIAEQRPKPLGSRIRVINRDGATSVLAGGVKNQDHSCLCNNILNCTLEDLNPKCPQRSKHHILSHEIGLNLVSAIAVTPDGALHLSDNKINQILTISPQLPSPDPSTGDVSLADVDAKEVYSFNRHGQHVSTHSMETGSQIYSFSYSKNTVFGKLTVASDVLGNKISLQRDYSGRVQSLENTYGEKRKVELTRLGRLKSIEMDSNNKIDFDYEEEGGLLKSVSGGDSGRFKSFTYDSNGRLEAVTFDSGESYKFHSGIVGCGGKEDDDPHFCANVVRTSDGATVRKAFVYRSGRVKLTANGKSDRENVYGTVYRIHLSKRPRLTNMCFCSIPFNFSSWAKKELFSSFFLNL